MSERKRRLYRAVITATPPHDERSPFGTGPHVASTVPRRIFRGGWWNEEIVYLAQEHAPCDQFGNALWVDPWDADPEDTRYWATFHGGQSRAFHSRANAERKARLWRAHGCKVRVDVSDVIAWTEGDAS